MAKADASPEASGKTVTLNCAAAPAPAAPPAPVAAPVPAPAPAANGIMVKQVVYGGNCAGKGKPDPNIKGADPTKHLADACNGKASCSYKINHQAIGDPIYGCAKDYKVEYVCPGSGPAKAEATPEASGKSVTLNCGAASTAGPTTPTAAPTAPPAPPAPAKPATGDRPMPHLSNAPTCNPNRAGYHQERYNSCMKTDSRGSNYCREWAGCPQLLK